MILRNPLFVSQPQNLIIQTGEDAVFSVEVSGEPPIQLQWHGYGDLLEGETETELVIPKVNFLSEGDFYCIAQNTCEMVCSETVSLDVISGSSNQGIFLSQGWNGISSYLWLDNPDVENLLEAYQQELIILMDDEGMYWPDMGINTFGLWNNHSGFKIKVTEPVELNFSGSIEPDKTIELEAGWNLISVMSECNADVVLLFEPVISDLIIVKEIAGMWIYWPEMSIYSLQNLMPGKAYFVMMLNAATIEFSNCNPSRAATIEKSTNQDMPYLTNLLSLDFAGTTPSSHIIAIPENVLTTAGIEYGDFIGAFSETGKCFGIVQVGEHQNIALTVFGDDVLSNEKDGFDEGDWIFLKTLNPILKTEMNLELVFEADFDKGIFKNQGLSVISHLKSENKSISTHNIQDIVIYPNPVKDKISFKGIENGAIAKLIDNFGQVLIQDFWIGNNQSINVSMLPQGVYFVEITVANKRTVKRFIILK